MSKEKEPRLRFRDKVSIEVVKALADLEATPKEIAARAWELTDAMMKERAKRKRALKKK